ncbi:MAG TPA: hypothetical protein VFV49_04155 [Thermoanaerobaculia bacterium]|nr:hypothetical protein [Thermoanaerobaculia bacterium]
MASSQCRGQPSPHHPHGSGHAFRTMGGVPIQVRRAGCLFSIIASLLLTLLLNLALRACS